MKKKKYLIIMLFITIITCGVIGLLSTGNTFFDSLFFTFVMFLGNYSEPTSNILVNFARFGALGLTATAVLFALKNVLKFLVDYMHSKNKDSIFIYGKNNNVDDFKRSCSNRIINRDDYMNASKYVLLSDDESNLEFYDNNKTRLQNKLVYIKNDHFPNHISKDGHVHYFSLNQLAAKKYFQNNLLLPLSIKNNKFKKELNIIFIGFDDFAEEVLYESLTTNIYNSKQTVKYTIYGGNLEILKSHKNLSKLNISYANDNYLEHISEIDKADKIFFFDNLQNLIKLYGLLNRGNITFFADKDIDKNLITDHRYGKNKEINLEIYNIINNICNPDAIINENEIYDAKLLNAAYNKSFGITKSVDEQWCELSTFHKFSNISCVDFYKNTIIHLVENNLNKNINAISDEEFDSEILEYAELEHMRWVNYHLFCNWEYNKKTDKNIKQHNCLVAFKELPEEEQAKDIKQIKFLRSIFNSGKL